MIYKINFQISSDFFFFFFSETSIHFLKYGVAQTQPYGIDQGILHFFWVGNELLKTYFELKLVILV
jgi:hypothetical protein